MQEQPQLILIAACDRNGAIGKGNNLPWRHRGDMSNFKNSTTGHIVVMGSKTYESMGCIPLPNRVNIVMTSDPLRYDPKPDTYFVKGLDEVFMAADGAMQDKGKVLKLYVIGGAKVYEQFLPMADVICLSRLDLEVEGADTFFPTFDQSEAIWDKRVVHFDHGAYAPNDVSYDVCVYTRKEPYHARR